MGAGDDGLTLQGLAQMLETQAQKLENLERENERMRSENAQLRSEVAVLLKGSGMRQGVDEELTAAASEYEGRISRRRLLSRAGAAAAGLLVAGALTQRDIREAKAAITESSHNANVAGVTGINHAGGAGVKGEAGFHGSAFRGAVEASNNDPNGYGVQSDSKGIGVRAFGRTHGVFGHGIVGVAGQSSTQGAPAVYGQHIGEHGYGVRGDGRGAFAGVWGRNPRNNGVLGEGSIGVHGQSTTGTGVMGQNTGSGGNGVEGIGRGASNAGVSGINKDQGGYGGRFLGGKAQLILIPGFNTGKPTGAHSKGEIFMDSRGVLFVCVADGDPATWRRVDTTAV
jgi:hypothetical protein